MDIITLHPFINFLSQHAWISGCLTALIAFLESLVFIGSIIPGSVTMTALGMLIATHALSFYSTLCCAILGAMLGDSFSYWLGLHYQEEIKTWRLIKHYQPWMEKVEVFFKRHGRKSVIIGRFFGPMRSAIPFIAGLMQMPILRFLAAAFIATSLWAIIYLSPGILLGKLSLQLPPQIATEFLIITLMLVALLWVSIWILERTFYWLIQKIDAGFFWIYQYTCQCKTLKTLQQLLCPHPSHLNPHHQLAKILCLLINSGLLIYLIYDLKTHHDLSHFNIPIYYLFQSLHHKIGTYCFTAITLFANHKVLLLLTLSLSFFLFWQKQTRTAWHLIIMMISSGATINFLKNTIAYPRPHFNPLLNPNSFPSGHVTLITTFLSFLVVIINQSLPKKKRHYSYLTAIAFILIVAFSRLYLEVHWFTDILGGLLIGLHIALIALLSYKRYPTPSISPWKLLSTTACLWLVISLSFSFFSYKKLVASYLPNWPIKILLQKNWWENPTTSLPIYRKNRFGNPAQPFNIQWLANKASIEKSLNQQGWTSKSTKFQKNGIGFFLERLASQYQSHPLPLLPLTYQNTPPTLIFIKNKPSITWVLRLWPSHTFIMDINSYTPLWIGTVQIYQLPSYLAKKNKQSIKTSLSNNKNLMNQTGILLPLLTSKYRGKIYLAHPQPSLLSDKHQWDHKILLIQEKGIS